MKKVYVNEEVCIGCGLCEVYCRLKHAESDDLVKAYKREQALPRLRVENRGVVSFSVRCQQCDDTPCMYACLTGAIGRNPQTGAVTVDHERCIGCWTCILVCPFGAIKQDKNNKVAVRCDLCPDEETPVCVANCPNEALVCIETDEMDSDKSGRAVASA
jgi:carbon-monoxide dehydrogenase iron sulfur subunit